jgi:hypothetical protein
MWYIHAVGNYLAIKMNEILMHTATGMSLESIMPYRKGHMLYDYIYVKNPNQANLYGQKNCVFQELRGRTNVMTA